MSGGFNFDFSSVWPMLFSFQRPPFSSSISLVQRRLTGVIIIASFSFDTLRPFCDVETILSIRCFIEGCDEKVNPQYLAVWMDSATFNAKYWKCGFPKSVLLPECAVVNNTDDVICDSWVFDKSVFSTTIVTDVSFSTLLIRLLIILDL